MVFTEYPATQFKKKGNSLSFFTRGDAAFTFRLVIARTEDNKSLPKFTVKLNSGETLQAKGQKENRVEYEVPGNSTVTLKWKA